MSTELLEREIVTDDVQALQELTEADPSIGILAEGCCCAGTLPWSGATCALSWVTCGTCTNTDN
ncbi:hypothetical protein ABZ777_02365 [Micromonospora parva]|uniref:hypothetical protein n=1 Tax=Micromonospora TaxID=1873 RepID=UPI001EE870B0|nr:MULTISPECIES: hypothetical protein [Micromonospora]MCG5452526.1 hypothetical protein [Micromonospora hortensis]MCX5118158.1 hypothetical protein [Micromonospora sp. NBC_00362]WTI09661.1 hypothetical protein OHB44_08335 [Micromonospora sp. NBC_00821]